MVGLPTVTAGKAFTVMVFDVLFWHPPASEPVRLYVVVTVGDTEIVEVYCEVLQV